MSQVAQFSNAEKLSQCLTQYYVKNRDFAKNEFNLLSENLSPYLTQLAHACKVDDLPLHPIFTPEKEVQHLSEGCAEIFKILYENFVLNFEDNKKDFLSYSQFQDFVFKIPNSFKKEYQAPLIARPDVLLSDGEFKIAEFNIGLAASFITQTTLQSMAYNRIESIKNARRDYQIFSRSPFVEFGNEVKRRFSQHKNIVFLTCHFLDYGRKELEYYIDYFNSIGLHINIDYIENLKFEGQQPSIEGLKSDFLMRLIPLEALVYSKSATPELLKSFDEYFDYSSKKPALCEPDDIWSILSSKQSLAFLWQNIHKKEKRAQELIRKYIPWSALIRANSPIVNEEEKLIEAKIFLEQTDKNQLVLKNGFGFDEKFVYIGSQISQAEWDQKCREALLKGNCIVQRYYKSDTKKLPFYKNDQVQVREVEHEYGLFLVDGKNAGMLSHFRDIEKENIKSNWNTTTVFTVEEDHV